MSVSRLGFDEFGNPYIAKTYVAASNNAGTDNDWLYSQLANHAPGKDADAARAEWIRLFNQGLAAARTEGGRSV